MRTVTERLQSPNQYGNCSNVELGCFEKETMRLADGTEHWVRERAKVRKTFRFLSKKFDDLFKGKKKFESNIFF